MSHSSGGPSPELFFNTVNAYQRTAAIRAAMRLSVFTAIAEGAPTANRIASRCGASERGIRILCDYLVMLGFLTKTGVDYALTPDSTMFLVESSPAYVGGSLEFLLSPMLTSGFDSIEDAVRRGGTALPVTAVDPENPVWVRFARGMAPLMDLPAKLMAGHALDSGVRPERVLDIAAGHGLFGIAFARAFPGCRVNAVDWPAVLDVARENADHAGVGDRYHTMAGSVFDIDLGGPYDVVLLTNFLHHFSPLECLGLLRKVRAALAAGGEVYTLEFVPNEDRVSPPAPAGFSLVMLAGTPAGDAYTFRELDRMFHSAGFSSSEIVPLPPSVEHLVISRP